MQEVRHTLETCDDGCPNQHYTKVVAGFTVDLRGHPLVVPMMVDVTVH